MIGEIIKDERKKANMTQDQLAKRTRTHIGGRRHQRLHPHPPNR